MVMQYSPRDTVALLFDLYSFFFFVAALANYTLKCKEYPTLEYSAFKPLHTHNAPAQVF